MLSAKIVAQNPVGRRRPAWPEQEVAERDLAPLVGTGLEFAVVQAPITNPQKAVMAAVTSGDRTFIDIDVVSCQSVGRFAGARPHAMCLA